jgi:hypothetical protein
LNRYAPDATMMMDRHIDGLAFVPGEDAIGAVWDDELHVTRIPGRMGTPGSSRPDGLLVSTGVDARIPIVDVATKKGVQDPWLIYRDMPRVAPSPRDSRFAIASNRELIVAEHGGAERSLVHSLALHEPSFLSFSDDGDELRVERTYAVGRIWPSGRPFGRARPVDEETSVHRWRDELGLVVSGHEVVRASTGSIVASCPSSVRGIARSPDGRILAVACPKETRLFAVGSGELLATVREIVEPTGERGTDQAVALVTSPDGRFEILGDPSAFRSQIHCAVGALAFPLVVCTERLHVPGLLGAILTGRDPNADPSTAPRSVETRSNKR